MKFIARLLHDTGMTLVLWAYKIYEYLDRKMIGGGNLK